MNNNSYSKETLDLNKKANEICHKYRNTENEDVCLDCKYKNYSYCNISALKDLYNIIDLKKLQEIEMGSYMSENEICLLDDGVCSSTSIEYCDKCLIETLLRDKNIRFVKKGEA